MKKKIIALLMSLFVVMSVAGCTEADKVSANLSTQADNFNVLRQVTVINCIANDVIFQMTGKMSIKADTSENQLEVVVENENGTYSKHIIGLSDNVTYVLEDIDTNYVEKYRFTINYNPKMWIPVEFDIVD
ncbi:hypothetical protein [Hungatella effluvii]|uniref:beta-sandwich lipoprotein n=1 Tax=Hungatella effluvii TaxID=1096246 RepID=UPI002A83BB71|nr:hypothetical protein [Hungatella effluvii]